MSAVRTAYPGADAGPNPAAAGRGSSPSTNNIAQPQNDATGNLQENADAVQSGVQLLPVEDAQAQTVELPAGAALEAGQTDARAQALAAGATTQNELEALEQLAQTTGMQVRYVYAPESDVTASVNGAQMTVNLASPDSAFGAAVHETGHAMRVNDERGYMDFQRAILRLADADKQMQQRALDIADAYMAQGSPAAAQLRNADGSVNAAALNEEISLKLAEELVQDPQKLADAVGSDRGLIAQFLDFVRGIKNSIAIKLTKSQKAMLDEAERTLTNLLRGEAGDVNHTQYSIRQDAQGKPYVRVDTDQGLFDGMSVNEMQKKAREIIRDRFKGRILDVGAENAYVPASSAKEFSYPANRRMSSQVKEAKMRSSPELDNLLSVSRYLRREADDGRHAKAQNWDVYETTFEVGGQLFTGEVKVMNTNRGREFYDITQIKKVAGNEQGGNTPADTSGNEINESARNTGPILNHQMPVSGAFGTAENTGVSIDSISNPAENVNAGGQTGKNSLRAERNGQRDMRGASTIAEYLERVYGAKQQGAESRPTSAYLPPLGEQRSVRTMDEIVNEMLAGQRTAAAAPAGQSLPAEAPAGQSATAAAPADAAGVRAQDAGAELAGNGRYGPNTVGAAAVELLVKNILKMRQKGLTFGCECCILIMGRLRVAVLRWRRGQ